MADDKKPAPTLAELEREGTRQRHIIGTQGLDKPKGNGK